MTMLRNRDLWPLYFLPIGAYLAFFFFYPLASGLLISVYPQGSNSWSLANYQRFFSDPKMIRILRFTALDYGIVTTLLSLLVAIPIAYKLRRPFRGISIIRSLTTLPMAYGGVIACSVLFIYLSGSGLFNLFLLRLGLVERPLRLMGNYIGLVISSMYTQVPFLFLFLLSAMVNINPSLEEAAKTLGATDWQVFRRVIFPLILPAVLTAGTLGYITNYGAFVNALICGDPAYRTRTIMIEAYHHAFQKFDWSMGIAITMIAGFVEMIFIFLYLRLQRRFVG